MNITVVHSCGLVPLITNMSRPVKPYYTTYTLSTGKTSKTNLTIYGQCSFPEEEHGSRNHPGLPDLRGAQDECEGYEPTLHQETSTEATAGEGLSLLTCR